MVRTDAFGNNFCNRVGGSAWAEFNFNLCGGDWDFSGQSEEGGQLLKNSLKPISKVYIDHLKIWIRPIEYDKNLY